jgi:hypothetical protein
MTTPKPPKDYGTNKLSQQPPRSCEIPGGPKARNLGEVEVKKLAEIERGGPDDRGFGSRR